MKTLIRLAAITGTLALASLVFVVAMGPLGVPSFFIVAAAALLGPTLYLLGRAGLSLLREPPAEEVQLATGRRRKELEREKQALLKAIKELEFDHEMGKISARDYTDFVARYRTRALDVMRRLDDTTIDYRKLIEKELAARLGKPLAEPTAGATPDAAGPPACPACSTVNDVDADFCKRCGKALRAAQEAS